MQCIKYPKWFTIATATVVAVAFVTVVVGIYYDYYGNLFDSFLIHVNSVFNVAFPLDDFPASCCARVRVSLAHQCQAIHSQP